jgi:hypothetical protein
MIPSVAATAACCGLRPVANAFGNDVYLRHRQASLLREPLGHLEERMRRTDLLRVIHAQYDLVREPVRTQIHQRGEREREHESLLPAEVVTEQQQHAAQRAEQQRGFQSIWHDVILPLPVGGCRRLRRIATGDTLVD